MSKRGIIINGAKDSVRKNQLAKLESLDKKGGTAGGKRRIFNFFESAPIKAFASL
jgi:hypothetical protein